MAGTAWGSGRGLHALREQGARPDVLGLNYYPELSCRELVRLDERIAHVVSDGGLDGILGELRRCHAAYGLPLMVTETAVEGETDRQCAWLDTLVAGLRRLRAGPCRSSGSPGGH